MKDLCNRIIALPWKGFIISRPRLKKIAGRPQRIVESAEDLVALVETDPAHWAVSVAPVQGFCIEQEFLDLLDVDQDQQILPEDILSALLWWKKRMVSFTPLFSTGKEIELEQLSKETPEGGCGGGGFHT